MANCSLQFLDVYYACWYLRAVYNATYKVTKSLGSDMCFSFDVVIFQGNLLLNVVAWDCLTCRVVC